MPLIFETPDAPSNFGTTQTLGIGQILAGSHTPGTDSSDWYRVTLTAGVTYGFSLVGTGANRLVDPFLNLYGPDGVTLVASNDDGFSNTNSAILFTPTTSGTYYLDANELADINGFPAGGSTYELSAAVIANGSKALVDDAMIIGAIDTSINWTSTNITYGFRTTPASYTNNAHNIASFTPLTAAEITAVQSCLQNYSDVCGLTFTLVGPVGGVDQATMLFGNYIDLNDAAGAFASYPGNTAATAEAGDVWLNTSSVSTISDPFGSYSYTTILHEIGHTTGLSHPGNYNAAPGVNITYVNDARFAQDSEQYTVMSYFDASNTGAYFGASPSTLMLYDIAALQLAYGVNTTTRVGNTIYGFSSTAGTAYDFTANPNAVFCIWDGGGSDTLNASGYLQPEWINLGAGSFSSIGGYTNNISIAFNCIIENAVGGIGNDTIIGNDVANALIGGYGNDLLTGGLGNDRFIFNASELAVGQNDTITDYTRDANGVGDTIALVGISAANVSVSAASVISYGNGTITDTVALNAPGLNQIVVTGYTDLANAQSGNIAGGFVLVSEANNQAAHTWSNYLQSYNAAGQLTTQNTINDNGSHSLATYDNAGQTWSSIVDQFNAGNALTSKTTNLDDGSHQVQYYDTAANPWSSIVDQFNTAGLLYAETTNFDTGARDTLYIDRNNQTWSTITDQFNTSGLLYAETTNYDVGGRQVLYLDRTNQAWTTILDQFNTSGNLFAETTIFDAGGRQVKYLDQTNQIWATIDDIFDNQNRLTSELTTLYNGNHTQSVFDVNSVYAWKQDVLVYDPTYHVTLHYQVLDDNSIIYL